jgi:hypothetical protein
LSHVSLITHNMNAAQCGGSVLLTAEGHRLVNRHTGTPLSRQASWWPYCWCGKRLELPGTRLLLRHVRAVGVCSGTFSELSTSL